MGVRINQRNDNLHKAMKTGKAAGCWYIVTERGKEYYSMKWRFDMRLREVLTSKQTK